MQRRQQINSALLDGAVILNPFNTSMLSDKQNKQSYIMKHHNKAETHNSRNIKILLYGRLDQRGGK